MSSIQWGCNCGSRPLNTATWQDTQFSFGFFLVKLTFFNTRILKVVHINPWWWIKFWQSKSMHYYSQGINLLVYISKSHYNRRTKITGLCRRVTRYRTHRVQCYIGCDDHSLSIVHIRPVQNIRVIEQCWSRKGKFSTNFDSLKNLLKWLSIVKWKL